MALPVVQYPTYEVYLHSLKRKIKFRPFLVKEEKILLIARESNDNQTVVNAIKQIVKNCCLEEIDVDALPVFDLEMFFIHLRMRSIGENVELQFVCNKETSNGVCDQVNGYTLELDKIEYKTNPKHQDIVKFSNTIGIKFKYPTLEDVKTWFKPETILDDTINAVARHVEYVFDGDSIYDKSLYKEEELVQFLESLSTDHINLCLDFFSTLPSVTVSDRVPCKKCGSIHHVYSEKLNDFFI